MREVWVLCRHKQGSALVLGVFATHAALEDYLREFGIDAECQWFPARPDDRFRQCCTRDIEYTIERHDVRGEVESDRIPVRVALTPAEAVHRPQREPSLVGHC